MTPPGERPRRSWRGQAAVATITLPLLLWLTALATVVLLDIAGYLVAASRAQSLADAAALAAVSTDATVGVGPAPRAEAARVAAAGDGELVACSCRAGRGEASVTVSVEVPGLVIPRLGIARVAADASAILSGT